MSSFRLALSTLLFALAASACGGAAESEAGADSARSSAEPPPVATRFELRVDGKRIDLGEPHGSRFHVESGDSPYSYVTVGAERDRHGGDAVEGAGVLLGEPFHTGAIDCTPDADGVTRTGAALSPGPFMGFTPRLTSCTVVVTWISEDRAVGRFSVDAHAPEESSLAGKVSKIEGEFDVPLKRIDL